ncbi:MAG: flagellar export protein FliJ [Spirochaetaceae bacterium]|jgi:flagellar FliJ protein|nr:flagellar export protein FliJ [Spirochaetaceae bacterium]
MKKFNFRLEKTLKIRLWTENEAKVELGRMIGELSVIEESIKENTLQRNSTAELRFSYGNLSNSDIYENYILRLNHEREGLLKKKREAEEKFEQARKLWVEAKAELKSMEDLKERRFTHYRKEALTEEEKQIEDLWRQRQD